MKKALITVSLIILTVAIIFVSCKKSENDGLIISGDKVFAEEAKNWFTSNFVNTIEYKNGTANGSIKMPNWRYGRTFSIGNIKMAEFPLILGRKKVYISEKLSEAENRIVIENTKFKALFIKAPNKPMEVRIIQFTPLYEYIKEKNFNISNLSFEDYAKDFKGDFMMFDFDNNFKKGYHFTTGGIKNISLKTKYYDKTIGKETSNYTASTAASGLCDNEMEINPNCVYTIHTTYEIICTGGWNIEEGFNPDYCHLEIISVICELAYCNGDPTLETCINQGNTQEECLCNLYSIGCQGGGEETTPPCGQLSSALENSTFEESTNTTGTSSTISETADEIEKAHFFDLGKKVIPIWATFNFYANNKFKIEKATNNIKKFKDYTFGETTVTGTSVWYKCVANTLTSSHKTISADKKTITGYHWYHYNVSLLFQGCPISEDHDRGIPFEIKIENY